MVNKQIKLLRYSQYRCTVLQVVVHFQLNDTIKYQSCVQNKPKFNHFGIFGTIYISKMERRSIGDLLYIIYTQIEYPDLIAGIRLH